MRPDACGTRPAPIARPQVQIDEMEAPAIEAMDESPPQRNDVQPAGRVLDDLTDVGCRQPVGARERCHPAPSNPDRAAQIRSEPDAAGPIDRNRVDRFVGQPVGFVEGAEPRPVERGEAVHRSNPDGAVRGSEEASHQRAGIANGRAVLTDRRARSADTRPTWSRLFKCARIETTGTRCGSARRTITVLPVPIHKVPGSTSRRQRALRRRPATCIAYTTAR